MVKLPPEEETPTFRIAYLGSSSSGGSEISNSNNTKTIKILTGQSNTMNNMQSYQQNQQQQQRPGGGPGYYPNYPASPPNHQGDLSGQGSGPQPNYQQGPPQPQPGQSESTERVPEAYIQIIGAIEKLVDRMDKMEGRLTTVENIMYHLTTNKKVEPEKGEHQSVY